MTLEVHSVIDQGCGMLEDETHACARRGGKGNNRRLIFSHCMMPAVCAYFGMLLVTELVIQSHVLHENLGSPTLAALTSFMLGFVEGTPGTSSDVQYCQLNDSA